MLDQSNLYQFLLDLIMYRNCGLQVITYISLKPDGVHGSELKLCFVEGFHKIHLDGIPWAIQSVFRESSASGRSFSHGCIAIFGLIEHRPLMKWPSKVQISLLAAIAPCFLLIVDWHADKGFLWFLMLYTKLWFFRFS